MDIKELKSRSEKNAKPFSATFELTTQCNFKCGFCYVCNRDDNKQFQLVKKEKSTRDWLYMLEEAAKLGLLYATFTGGDVFVRKDFEEIYCKSYEMGLRPIVNTNAALIDASTIKLLKKYPPVRIEISLYGMSDATYEKVCGVNGAYEKVINVIHALKQNNIQILIKALALRPLLADYAKMAEFVHDEKLPFLFGNYLYTQRDNLQTQNTNWQLNCKEIIEVKKIFVDREIIKKPKFHQDFEPKAFTCSGGKTSFTITSDGKMQPCPTLSECYTLPFEQGFEAAWNELREKVQAYACCTECESCVERAYCHNCPARRYSATGSVEKCNDDIKAMARIKHELCDYYQE